MSLCIFHTSDWHLGHELSDFNRENEHQAFLDWLSAELISREADMLLVTGDIFDVANPPISAMRQLFHFLNHVTFQLPNLQILILGGNHDSAQRIELPAALLGGGHIHFIGQLPRSGHQTDYDRIILPIRSKSGEIGAYLAALPFCRPSDLGVHSLDRLYQDVQTEALNRAGRLPVILTGHLHVSGGQISELSERRITVGGEEASSTDLFNPNIAYVALGHLHRPQQIKGPTLIRYAGSPFPLSSTERNYRHSITIVDLEPGAIRHEQVEIPRPIPFLFVGPLPLDQTISAIHAIETDPDLPLHQRPFLEVHVQVDGPQPNLQARIQEAANEKAIRLTRVKRINTNEITISSTISNRQELREYKPEDMFKAIFLTKYNDLPDKNLERAFEQLLADTHHNSEG